MKKEPLLSQILVVWIVGIGWTLIAQLVPTILSMIGMDIDVLNRDFRYQLLFLYTEIIGIICMFLYYHNDHYLIPIRGENVIKQYFSGWCFGILLFFSIWATVNTFGGYHIDVVFKPKYASLIFLFSIGFGIQSFFEELVCRGYVMGYWLKENKLMLAIITNSILFTFLHIGNPFFDWYAAIGLFLFGVLMSLFRIIFHNIWVCSAVHAAWNFAEGIIFGTAVSGLPNMGLLLTSSNTTSSQTLTGGSFGIERSGVSITVHIILIAILVLSIIRKQLKS